MPTVHCPACKARYKVPDSAAGKRATCKKCGASFRVPTTQRQPDEGDVLISFEDFDAIASGHEVERPEGAPIPKPPPSGRPSALPEAVLTTETMAYAPSAEARTGGGWAGFLSALGRSAFFFTDTGNLATFIVVCLIMIVGLVVSFGTMLCCIGLVAAFIINGWYMWFQLQTVVNAAGGEDDLPTIALTGGIMDEVFVPFFKMLAATMLAHLPGAAFVVVAHLRQGASGVAYLYGLKTVFGDYEPLLSLSSPESQVLGAVMLAFGLLFWPMFILVVAIGGFPALVRVDLMAITVIRSAGAYLFVTFLVLVCKGITYGVGFAGVVVGVGAAISGQWSLALIVPVLLTIVSVYATIVAMRAIGLYYHYFKHRFAWSWG